MWMQICSSCEQWGAMMEGTASASLGAGLSFDFETINSNMQFVLKPLFEEQVNKYLTESHSLSI